VLLLLTVAFSGCAEDGGDPGRTEGPDPTPTLSQKRFGILPPEEVWVASTVDGKRIHNVVYRPDAEEDVPVWINFSPYWGDTADEEGDAFARYMIHEYVPRGYAVVLSAVRGTGHSEGCFPIAGDLEIQDAYDVIDHFASADWGSGKVGAGGKSYDSTTQNGLIAKDPHPALRAVFHVGGITDMYRYNYRDGVPYFNGLAFTPRYYASQGFDEYTGEDEEDAASLQRAVDDAACPEAARHAASGTGSAAAGMKDAYWIERDWNRYIADSAWDGGVFFVHGLQDWNVKPDHILPWLGLLPPHVHVKAWLHQWQEGGTGHVYPMRDDWNTTMLRWMDHWLKDVDTGILDEPRFEVQGTDGRWRASDAWPVEDGTFAWGGGTGDAGITFDDPFRASGPLRITYNATVLGPDPVLSVVVTDQDGAWVTEGVLRGVYKDGLEAPAPLVPGTAYTFVFETYPVDVVLPAGGGLRLALQAEPRHSLPTPLQLAAVSPLDRSVHVRMHMADPADGLLGEQPTQIGCFAC